MPDCPHWGFFIFASKNRSKSEQPHLYKKSLKYRKKAKPDSMRLHGPFRPNDNQSFKKPISSWVDNYHHYI